MQAREEKRREESKNQCKTEKREKGHKTEYGTHEHGKEKIRLKRKEKKDDARTVCTKPVGHSSKH